MLAGPVVAVVYAWTTFVLSAHAAGLQSAPATSAPGAQAGGGGGGFKQPEPYDFSEHDGWASLFDGKTLNGWSGDSNWKVEDGAITIESTCEKPTGTVYLVWKGGEASDFELKMEMKGTGSVNSGVQYRGWIAPLPPRLGGGPGRAGQTGSCPSGAARGTPPSAESEAQWNMWGAQNRLRCRQSLHGPVLRAVDGPRDRGVERTGRAG